MRYSSLCVALVVNAMLLVAISPVYGTMITVANSSFEDFTLSDGDFSHLSNGASAGVTADVPVPSWTTSGNSNGWIGTHNPDSSNYSSGLPEGNGANVGYMDEGALSQTLSVNLAANTLYTLQVDIGRRNDSRGDEPTWEIELYAGSTQLVYDQIGTESMFRDSWSTRTLTFETGANVTSGQALKIVLSNYNGTGTANFDNVRLDATTIPEPTSIAMTVIGLIGLLCYAWRKRQ